jgi:hypothetical protein
VLDLRSEGWYGLKLTQKSEVPSMLGLAIPDTTPVLLARYRCPAPYPDIEVALPLEDESARDWVAGDRETCAVVGLELAKALQHFLAQVRTGRDPDEVN